MEGFLNPEEVLNQFELRADMIVADFGCGSGGFTVPLAKRLEDGLIHALDVQEVPLSALKSRAITENITNIRFIRCNLEKPKGSTLSDSFVDLVLIANTLFQSEDKVAIISEAERILKSKGKLLVIDWLPGGLQGPVKGRVSPAEIKKIAKNLKFEFEKEFSAGKYHYGLIFNKP